MKRLTGDTYPHKETIKKHGGMWDSQTKSWSVPDEAFEKLQALCKKPTLNLNGQLWEPCRCGQEPIYLSHGGVCESCARKGRVGNHMGSDFY